MRYILWWFVYVQVGMYDFKPPVIVLCIMYTIHDTLL